MKDLLAFVHIEKAAGTTLVHILRRNFFGRYMDVRPLTRSADAAFTANDLRLSFRVNPFLGCIAGHSLKPDYDLDIIAPQIRYITLLRDPVDRYISQFRYWNRYLGKNQNFEQFFKHAPAWNVQTRKIDRNGNIEQAKKRLEENFFQVGLVEDFDEFLVLLKAKIASKHFDIRYQSHNTAGSDNTEREQLLQKYGDDIRRANSDDIALYNWVKNDLLPRQRLEYGDSLDADIMMAEADNKRLRPRKFKSYMDYAMRKLYIEPVSGLIRCAHGLPSKGSYSDY